MISDPELEDNEVKKRPNLPTNASKTEGLNYENPAMEENESGAVEGGPSPAKKTRIQKEPKEKPTASELKCSPQELHQYIKAHVQAYFAAGESDNANNLLWGKLIGANINNMTLRNQRAVKHEIEHICYLGLKDEFLL